MRLTRWEPSNSHASATDSMPRGVAAAASVVALIVVFALDRGTGSAPLQHLYYVPIVFGAIRFGTRGAVALAAAATVLYHAANPHLLSFHYEEADLVQIALFAAVGIVSAKLAGDARRLHRLAMTDDLTGLHNLRSFEPRLEALVRAARATNAPLSVLVLDLDRLKSLNDAHGHLCGAEAVRTVGHVLASRLRDGDVACRYGGDEFVVALPDCTVSRAADVARDLCLAVNMAAPVLAGRQFPAGTLSISVGVACDDGADAETLFRAADVALYLAKDGGRNRVGVGPVVLHPFCREHLASQTETSDRSSRVVQKR